MNVGGCGRVGPGGIQQNAAPVGSPMPMGGPRPGGPLPPGGAPNAAYPSGPVGAPAPGGAPHPTFNKFLQVTGLIPADLSLLLNVCFSRLVSATSRSTTSSTR